MIYLLPLLLMFLGFLCYDNPNKINKGNGLWILIYFILISIMGLRYKVGGDTYNYMTYFLWSPEVSNWEPFDLSGFEPGFSFFTSLIKTYTDNIYIYQTIISAIMTLMLMKFIKRYTDYKFIALIIIYIAVYIYFSTEIIRESLTVCGLLTAHKLLERKKYLRYFLVCLLLTTFHSSAVVTFLFPFLHFLKFNKKLILYILFIIAFGVLMSKIMNSLAQYYIFNKLLRYTDHSYVGYLWCGFRFIYFSLLPILVLYICKLRYKLPCQFENIICFQIILGFGLWFVPIVFQRLINYTIVFYIVSMVQMFGTIIRDKTYRSSIGSYATQARERVAHLMIFLTIIAHSSYYIHLDFYEIFIPYHSAFDPIEVPEREKYVPGNN